MAGGDIVWRRGLAEMASALRGLNARFDCYLIPLGPDALNEPDIRSLTADGELEHVYEGPTEYLLRLEVALSFGVVAAAMQNDVVESIELPDGPFRPLTDCMLEWNARLGIPAPDLFGFAAQEGAESDSYRAIVLGEWHVVTRPFASVLSQVVEDEHAVIDTAGGGAGNALLGPGLSLRGSVDADTGEVQDDLSEEDELRRFAEQTARDNDTPEASLARARYAQQWHRSLSHVGREFFLLAANDPDSLINRDLGPVVMAGMGKVHPVMSHFPKVLHAIPEQIALLLPPTLAWLIWPTLTEWSRPSLALPSASAMTWAAVHAWSEPGADLPTHVVGHPLGMEAPAGYHAFFRVARDMRARDRGVGGRPDTPAGE